LATPVGHALAGVALGWGLTWRRPLLGPGRDVLLFALVAQLPDLDFIPGLLMGVPAAFHHEQSHSLGAACLAAGLAALWGRRQGQAGRWGLAVGLSYFLHVLIDWATMDFRPPLGVPLWWPLSSEYFLAASPIFLDVKRGAPDWELLAHTTKAFARELLILGPPFLLLGWFSLRRQKRRV
jgi:membrane-bound metal-dependent hydrolase YbcI (DUF457 family)